ncbi:MAG: hypothetical protein CL792_01480 [Chloroflexi bacterium]|nr:hypothetical protein [Chloroflexota bacterium]|tara:strand:- start:13968 stop:15050 length:1083 start_codon:yes stop_codon:yes gene_type:complete
MTTPPLDIRPICERLVDLEDEFTSADSANIVLYNAGLTDGLPVIAPTAEKIDQMLGSLDPTLSATQMPLPPGFVIPNLRDIAACAVLAGCDLGVVPLIASALDAMTDPEFNLLGIQTTTGAAAPLITLNGPIINELRINNSHNVLGQGSKPNATIGRAIRLALQNIAFAIPGSGDMATHGHSGKYTWLIAENEEGSVWPPFHTTRGFKLDESTVTVIAGVGSVEVVLPQTTAEDLVRTMSRSMLIAGNLGRQSFGGGQPAILLPPEAAQFLSEQGWDRERFQEALYDESKTPLSWLSPHAVSRITANRIELGIAESEHIFSAISPEDILIIVTGGVGIKATFVPTWGATEKAITRPIVSF